MKKILIILVGILLGVFLILSLLDKSDYGLEKRVWRLQKQFDRVARDPKVVPDRKFDDLVVQYRKLARQYPDSELTSKVNLKIGLLYALKMDFVKARDAFGEILRLYPDDKVLCSTALLNIGNTYESENNEKKAVETYKHVMNGYSTTDVGLNMPLYIANYYLKTNRSKEYKEAVDDAVRFYKKQVSDNSDSSIGFNALRLLVTAYYAQESWSDAINTLGKILLDYANSPFLNPQRAALMIKSINTTSVTKLNDYEKPIAIYKEFIEKNPNHPINKILEQMVNSLKQLDDAKVRIVTDK